MPSVLPQLDNDSILLMYLAGELSAEECSAVEAHLRGATGMEVWWTSPGVGSPASVVTQPGC